MPQYMGATYNFVYETDLYWVYSNAASLLCFVGGC